MVSLRTKFHILKMFDRNVINCGDETENVVHMIAWITQHKNYELSIYFIYLTL